MHDKWHSSVNMLCHREMILIHGYVSIAKQLANLKVSEIKFGGVLLIPVVKFKCYTVGGRFL